MAIEGSIQVYAPETVLTLDGLSPPNKKNLLNFKSLNYYFNRKRWDDYVNNVGLRFLLSPRIGMPRPKIEGSDGEKIAYPLAYCAPDDIYNIEEKLKRYHDVGRCMENKLGTGLSWLKDLENEITANGVQINPNSPWFENLSKNRAYFSETQWKKRFSDWADTDAIAAHYAYGADVFCTNDKASGAGSKSILSKSNREYLQTNYGIRFLTLSELKNSF